MLDVEGVDRRRVTLVPGWFSDTCVPATARKFNITKASVIMVDCDIYSSTKEALTFCAPLITDKALMLFDDWHTGQLAAKNLGERRAFEEWLAESGQFTAEPFGTYRQKSETFIVTRTRSPTDLTDFTVPADRPCTITFEPLYKPTVCGKSAVNSIFGASRGLAMTLFPQSPRLAMPKAATSPIVSSSRARSTAGAARSATDDETCACDAELGRLVGSGAVAPVRRGGLPSVRMARLVGLRHGRTG